MGPAHGIRTRKGAELRKREAFSSAAREERSDEAGRGRRQPHADIPHRPPLNWKRSSQGDRFCLGPAHGIRTRQGAELRKRASVFQRSTQGAKRRSGARPPQADAVSALGDAPKCRHYRNVPKCRLGTIFEDPPKDCGQKNGKYEYCYRCSYIIFVNKRRS